jgi:F0F1-type ATP synthase membrane subunit b/b'
MRLQTDLSKLPTHVRDEIEEAKPSKEPAYWAKPSCKKCYGRGIVGVLTQSVGKGNTIRNEQLCSCVEKAWQAWQEDFLDRRELQKKEQEGKPSTNLVSPSSQDKSKAVELVQERLDRLDKRIRPYQVSILGFEQQLDELPQEETVENLQGKECEILLEAQANSEMIESAKQQAAAFEAEAENYRQMAKEAQKKAADLRSRASNELSLAGEEIKVRLQGVREMIVKAERELNRARHQIRRKVGEIQKKLDKLVSRKSKVIAESRLDLDFIAESGSDSAGSALFSA